MLINKLHPPAEYDPKRSSGRTTATALRLLANAIAAPGVQAKGRDHYPGRAGVIALMTAIASAEHNLGLKHITVVNYSGDWVGVTSDIFEGGTVCLS